MTTTASLLQKTELSRWIAFDRPGTGARVRLFCFPYAGVGASIYRPWLDALAPEVRVCPVQLPGREARIQDPAFENLLELAEAAADALAPRLAEPFAIFGHSLGALVGFELARALRRRGGPEPAHLFVSARRAPQLPEPHPPIRHLGDSEFIAEVQRRYGGIPSAVLDSPDLVKLLLPGLRADFALIETYVYQEEEPLRCPISAFGGAGDQEVGAGQLAAWRDQTSGRFQLTMLPGDHFFLQSARSQLVALVGRELSRVPLAGGPDGGAASGR